ncbi:MAG: hypothetical protein AMXMBFR59_29380 [Rhodanobacteraceae bacterium]
MIHPKALGRLLGFSMLATFLVGLISNFVLQDALFAGGGLLVNAAAHPMRIGLIALLGSGTSLLSLWVASLLVDHFRERHGGLLRFYLAVLAVGLALTLLEFSTLVAFRELSAAHHAAAGADTYVGAGTVLAGLRNGIHYLDKILGGFSVATLFVFLLSSHLLPRWIAGFGLLGAGLQMLAVGRALFGFEVAFELLIPLSLAFLVTMAWLLALGFAAPGARQPVRSKPASDT